DLPHHAQGNMNGAVVVEFSRLCEGHLDSRLAGSRLRLVRLILKCRSNISRVKTIRHGIRGGAFRRVGKSPMQVIIIIWIRHASKRRRIAVGVGWAGWIE